MTNAQKNQLAGLVAVAVALALFLIAPASRGWITSHAVMVTTTAYDTTLAPAGQLIAAAWNWVTGLLPW